MLGHWEGQACCHLRIAVCWPCRHVPALHYASWCLALHKTWFLMKDAVELCFLIACIGLNVVCNEQTSRRDCSALLHWS